MTNEEIARAFFDFVYGQNRHKIQEKDIARVSSYLSWTPDNIAADANRNIEAWQVRLFAYGIALGQKSTLATLREFINNGVTS